MLAGFACLLIGMVWSTCYAMVGRLDLMLVYGFMIATGLAAFASIRHSSQLALCGIGHAMLLLVTGLSLIDVPTLEIPRSVHLYFLPLAVAAFYVFGAERRYMGIFFPSLCVVGFIVFGARIVAPDLIALAPPDSIRVPSSMANHVLSGLLIVGILLIYREDMSLRIVQAQELARAITHKQLLVLYQPQVDEHGRTTGAEALVRWQHPSRGLLTPDKFIPLAEESLLIIDVGLDVLRQVCKVLSQWAEVDDLKSLTLAVNVSPLQLSDPDFSLNVRKILEQTGANPARLELELTESALSVNTELVRSTMWELQSLGIRWALDDFGTGFSSLGLLRTLPLEKIKIDRQFIIDAMDSQQGRRLLEKIVEIPQVLGMSSIAEGIEDLAHFNLLKDMGCRAFQGYLFGRPQAVDSLVLLITRKPA